MSLKRTVLMLLAAVVAALALAACGGDDDDEGDGGNAVTAPAGGTPAAGAGGTVQIAFSAPGADHGWLAAVADDAQEQAEQFDDVDFNMVATATSSADQEAQIQTMINQKPDALVILPFEGEPLTPIAEQAMKAGIPVINVDREFSTPSAYRTLIAGDNYGVGYQAGQYFARELDCQGNVVEIQGLAGISVTQQRSQAFRDALQDFCPDGGIDIIASQPADFLPDKGLSVMENILSANDDIDAVYTHDDDMAEGVVAAIENAGREDEMFLTGVGPSANAMEAIQEGGENGLYRATFTYSPIMSASGVSLARLIAKGQGLSELVEPEVPQKIVVPATLIDAGNVDQFLQFGF